MSNEIDKMEVILRAKAMMEWVEMRVTFGRWTTRADSYFKAFFKQEGRKHLKDVMLGVRGRGLCKRRHWVKHGKRLNTKETNAPAGLLKSSQVGHCWPPPGNVTFFIITDNGTIINDDGNDHDRRYLLKTYSVPGLWDGLSYLTLPANVLSKSC